MSKHYLCGVDYQHENDQGKADYYDFINELKDNKSCWKQCGIVELELDEQGNEIGHTWIVRQNLFGDKND